MKHLTRIALLALIVFASFAAFAVQPARNYSDKTIAQLLPLLESSDAIERHCAVIFIGARYRNPKAIVVNGPMHKLNSPAPEFPIPSRVTPALTTHVQTDSDWSVRVCALGALRDLRFHTNTTPIVAFVLVRHSLTSPAIILSHCRKTQSLRLLVASTQKARLNSFGRQPNAAKQLGIHGASVVPALRTLKHHNSPKVRHYAEKALSQIEATTKKRL